MILRKYLALSSALALLTGCSLNVTRVFKTENNYYVVIPKGDAEQDDEDLNPEGRPVYLIGSVTNTVVAPDKARGGKQLRPHL